MDYSPEVLIYIQSVKKFIFSNDSAREYFLEDVNEEDFFNHLTEISQYNFNKHGDPTLSKGQFEVVRVSLKAFKEIDEAIQMDNSIFSFVPNDMSIYLK